MSTTVKKARLEDCIKKIFKMEHFSELKKENNDER